MTELTQEWHRCQIDKKILKSLSRRNDKTPLLWFGSYILLQILLGIGVAWYWGTWTAVWFYVAYCFVWGFCASAVHETCHGTPFKTRWMNEAALWLFGWMGQFEPVFVRWGHAGHHSYTHFDEGDTELSEPNPVSWSNFFKVGLGVWGALFYWQSLIAQAFGKFSDDMRAVVPDSEVPKAIRNARIMLLVYGLFVVLAVAMQSWLLIFLFILPRIFGGPVVGIMHLTQHTGLQMNIRDHRYSTRSFYAGPLTRFFYFNMNYHVEHHMFPMVPFYNLPALHEEIKDQLAPPCNGMLGVYKEVLAAVKRQQTEPGYHIRKAVPQPV